MSLNPKVKKGSNAPTLEELELDRLAPSVATYGHYCRSASFAGFAHEVWMEALQVTPGFWSLREVRSETTLDKDSKKGETQIIASNKLCSLIEALRTLYNFEQSHKDNAAQYLQVTRESDLGIDHYVAFGQREAFAFDNTGRPLVTVNGHIVEGENIAYETIEKVRNSWAEKQMLFMSEADELLPHFNLSVEEEDLDAFLISLHNRNFIDDVSNDFEACIKSFDKLLEDKHSNSLHSHEYFLKLSRLKSRIQDQFPQGDGHDAPNTGQEYYQVLNRLTQYVLAMELHGRLYVAKETFTRIFNRSAKDAPSPDIAYLKGDIMKAAEDIQDKYIALGNEPVTIQQIQAEIIKLNKPFGHVLEARPKAFRVIMNTMDDMKKRSVEITNELRMAALKQEHDAASKKRREQDAKAGRLPIGSYMADRIKPKFR